MTNEEILQEWLKEFPVGTRILWHDQYNKRDWLPGVVTGHKSWTPERGRLNAAISFRLDGEPEKVKQGDEHNVHYISRRVLKKLVKGV